MEIITSPAILQEQCLSWKSQGLSIALVPTMGYFHPGHESLMQEGRELADKLVVSLFVNPTQFEPGSDLESYPRDPIKDTEIAMLHGTDILFMPTPESMYYPDHATWVEVPDLAQTLCGQARPSHFRGVATVVTKLFMLAQPTWALFGEKDWQQLAVIRRMTRDLAMPVQVIGMPVVRENDGLAMSSRNAYLSPEEREAAQHIQLGLRLAQDLVAAGVTRKTSVLQSAIREYWQRNMPSAREDYLCFVDPDTLQLAAEISGPTLAAAAVHMTRARLIDNLLIQL